MNIQSLYIETPVSFIKSLRSKAAKLGNNYQLYKRFGLGEKPNMNKVIIYSELINILTSDNCDLVDFINKNIFELKLEDTSCKICK